MRFVLLLFATLLLFSGVNAQLQNNETPFLPGELLVRVTDNALIETLIHDFRTANGVETGIGVIARLSEKMRIWHLRFDDAAVNSYEIKRAIALHPAVEAAQFNHHVQMRETVPNDPQFGQQWHHVNANGSDIDSDLAWDITTGGFTAFNDEIVVCVIEGGNLNHPDLVDNKWVNENEIPGNGIDDDGNGYIDDYNGWNVASQTDAGVFQGGHGTSVMGMIGAKGNNDLGVAGINWDVKIMSVAGENLGQEASVVAAYDYPLTMRLLYEESGGELGAFVVATNASWGIDNANANNYPIWCGVYDTLGEAGILNCGATANNNVNIDVVSDMPTGCSSPYMVAVTATNNNDVRTFSGYGVNTIDLAAPGEAVRTTSGSTGYTTTSGTSFASPLTAGAIALIYSSPCPSFAALVHADPQAGADLVYQVLMDGCDPVPNLANEVISGGRLNVFNSIQLLLQQCSDSDCFAPFGVNVGGDPVEGYTMSWGSTAGMLAFNVRYRAVGEDEWVEIAGVDANTFDFPELEWCTEYEAQVMAQCDEEESIWSPLQIWLTGGCCEAPAETGFAITEIGENGAQVSWSPVLAAESYSVTIIDDDGQSQTFDNIINTSFFMSGLASCMAYTVEVSVNCGDETVPAGNSGNFITLGCGPCRDPQFCASSGGTDDEWIQRIQLASLDHNSGDNNGYADFTADPDLSTVLDPGGTYTLTLTPGYAGTEFNEIWRVWLDYNGDGFFTNNEIVFTTSTPSNAEVTGTFSVPVTQNEGQVRMRVSMKYAGFFGNASPPAPCEVMQYGEVEDYCIAISSDIVNVFEQQTRNWSVFPNPTSGTLNVQLPSGVHLLEVLDLTGRMVMQQPTQGSSVLSLDPLASGTYLIRLITDGIPMGTQRVMVTR